MNKIFKTLEIEEGKAIKLFFRGKPLKDEESIILHKITNNDVILYMLVEAPKLDNNLDVSIITSSLNSQEDSAEQNNPNRENRGFNRFRSLGMANSEIQLIRILFHTATIAQHRMDPSQLNAEMFLQREESWLNENNPDLINYNNNRNNLNPSINENRNSDGLRVYHLRSNYLHRQPTIIRTHLFMPRENDDFFSNLTQRESNVKFFLGFLLGAVLSLYALIFLVFCKFRPKFRTGMIVGMIFSSFIMFVYHYSNPRY